MRSNNIPAIVQWWVTPKLPIDHIFIPPEKRPKGINEIFRVYIRKWLIHPIKRRLAKYYLIFLKKFFGIKVIAITGSAGKTTTKEMLFAILRQKDKTVASFKNIDPVYNIPMTILKCTPATKFLILEFGVEYPGEMEFYLWLAQPDIGVITNIYPTHTQFFKDTNGVAEEKANLLKSLPKDGFAILNNENKYTRSFAKKTKAKVIRFGEGGQVRAENTVLDKSLKTNFTLVIKKDKIDVQLSFPGRQFVYNALAAVSTAHVLGVSREKIKKGLESHDKPEHRMDLVRLHSGALLLDDSYNNNPEAAKESLRTFKEIAGNKETIVVFGDMLELGNFEKEYHRELGEFISSLDIRFLIGVGELSRVLTDSASKKMAKNRIFWVKNEARVDKILKPLLNVGSAVLIKGSRSIGLDKLVSRLS